MADLIPDEPTDVGNSDDDFESFVRQLLAEDPIVETPPPEGDEPEGDETPPAETPPPASASTDLSWQWDDGLAIDREKARNLALFDQWLEANPQLASQIAGVAQGQFELVPKGSGVPNAQAPTAQAPPASTAPAELDLDDPIQRRLWDELNSTRKQLDAAGEVLTRHEAQIQQTGANTTRALVDRVATEYATKKNLSAEELNVVRQQAARLNIVSSLASPIDPVTQLPRTVDPVQAVEQALDTAYWSIPQFRDRALADMTKAQIEDIRKKAKLTSLGGSSGSVPRKATRPTNENERREAMVAQVAADWNNNGS